VTRAASRAVAVTAAITFGLFAVPGAARSATASGARLGAPAVRGTAAAVTADPASNTSPSSAFVNACYPMSTSKADNDACDAAALHDFNAVRAGEGLGPMVLPGDFDTLDVPHQLLAISDIERVDRGLPPVAGLSSRLDGYAQTGADNDEDPPWPSPFPGTAGTGNWAGAGNSALLDDFYWMYDDGIGSGNLDCTPSDQSGCWGHRHDILWSFATPLVMGAAVAYGTPYGTSMTEEFIGGDHTDSADVAPTWATIAATIPSGQTATITATTTSITAGESVTLTGTFANAGAPVSGESVELQRRHGTGPWADLASQLTNPKGIVKFKRAPTTSTKFRVEARASGGAVLADSPEIRIVVG
jgi:hypothetical protein